MLTMMCGLKTSSRKHNSLLLYFGPSSCPTRRPAIRSNRGFYEKRDSGEPVCIDDEIPFEILESWEWARLESVTIYIQGGKSPKKFFTLCWPFVPSPGNYVCEVADMDEQCIGLDATGAYPADDFLSKITEGRVPRLPAADFTGAGSRGALSGFGGPSKQAMRRMFPRRGCSGHRRRGVAICAGMVLRFGRKHAAQRTLK